MPQRPTTCKADHTIAHEHAITVSHGKSQEFHSGYCITDLLNSAGYDVDIYSPSVSQVMLITSVWGTQDVTHILRYGAINFQYSTISLIISHGYFVVWELFQPNSHYMINYG